MPEYLAPAVYVEETSFRAKSIEGVGTSTTGFAGPTLTGPHGETPELLTSFADFQRIYGGLDDLTYGSSRQTNYLAHAVRAYFDEGGSRLYVSRVVPASAQPAAATIHDNASFKARFKGRIGNGSIRVSPTLAPATSAGMARAPVGSLVLRTGAPARLEGTVAPFNVGSTTLQFDIGTPTRQVAANVSTTVAEVTAGSQLADPITATTLKVAINGVSQPAIAVPAGAPQAVVNAINAGLLGGYARLSNSGNLIIGAAVSGSSPASIVVEANAALGFATTACGSRVTSAAAVTVAELDLLLRGAGIRAATVEGKLVLTTVETGSSARLQAKPGTHELLGTPSTQASGSGDAQLVRKTASGWVDSNNGTFNLPAPETEPVGDFVTLSLLTTDGAGREGRYEDVGLDPAHPRWIGNVLSESPSRRSDHLQHLYAISFSSPLNGIELYNAILNGGQAKTFTLTGGSDGAEPTTNEYKAALEVLGSVEDISILAAPGSSDLDETHARGVRNELIAQAERRRAYRIAVLDAPPEMSLSEVRAWRGEFDSKHAAFYYPWVVVANPLAQPGNDSIPKELPLPPSGFVCGVYARSDVERGVFKAPANETVRTALRFESDINFAQQEVLNPLGVNCLRSFPGRGNRVWGARTASSDPEWKYVNVRRFFNYLERSIDIGTQWAVFEPNGERLWANIRETISSFLYNEWRSGALLGSEPKQAFFVRCDRSTMTQDDLDNGRLICLVGVAVVKPAEFVIFRIGQKTADARS